MPGEPYILIDESLERVKNLVDKTIASYKNNSLNQVDLGATISVILSTHGIIRVHEYFFNDMEPERYFKKRYDQLYNHAKKLQQIDEKINVHSLLQSLESDKPKSKLVNYLIDKIAI